MACGEAEAYRGPPYPIQVCPCRREEARPGPGRGSRKACGYLLSVVTAWILRRVLALCGFLLSVLRRDGFRLLLPWQFLLYRCIDLFVWAVKSYKKWNYQGLTPKNIKPY